MKEAKCPNCGHILAKDVNIADFEIKCHKCKSVVRVKMICQSMLGCDIINKWGGKKKVNYEKQKD
jgi:phage FluMu protein Com